MPWLAGIDTHSSTLSLPRFWACLLDWDTLAFGLHCVIDKSSISSVQLSRAQLAIGARPYITVAA